MEHTLDSNDHPTRGLWHWLTLSTATVWLIMATYFYLRLDIIDITYSPPAILGTSVQFNPSPERTRTEWNMYTNGQKGYSFSYPPDWPIEERDGFINSTHIFPPGRELEIIYSEGQIPTGAGKIVPAENTIQLDIQGESYMVKEQLVNNAQKFFHISLHHPSKPIDITVRTLTGDIAFYESHKQTILDIMATTTFIPVQPPAVRAGFAEYLFDGLKLYYPAGLQRTSEQIQEIIWGDTLFIMHRQQHPYEIVKKKMLLQVRRDGTRSITVQSVKSEDMTIAGEIITKKDVISCGKQCAYQIVRFEKNGIFYEFIFAGAGKRERRIFDEMMDSIRFE